jgi:hypothetical protein
LFGLPGPDRALAKQRRRSVGLERLALLARQECSAMGRLLFRRSPLEAEEFERKRPSSSRGKPFPETVSERTPTPRALMVVIH